jgi:hypothetical protein
MFSNPIHSMLKRFSTKSRLTCENAMRRVWKRGYAMNAMKPMTKGAMNK